MKIFYDPINNDATFHPGVQASDRTSRFWTAAIGCLGVVITLLSHRKIIRKSAP